MQCPRCSGNSEKTQKKWVYGIFTVEGMICKKCNKKYNVYFKNGTIHHTIPKKKIIDP
jgi:hypothetical protein